MERERGNIIPPPSERTELLSEENALEAVKALVREASSEESKRYQAIRVFVEMQSIHIYNSSLPLGKKLLRELHLPRRAELSIQLERDARLRDEYLLFKGIAEEYFLSQTEYYEKRYGKENVPFNMQPVYRSFAERLQELEVSEKAALKEAWREQGIRQREAPQLEHSQSKESKPPVASYDPNRSRFAHLVIEDKPRPTTPQVKKPEQQGLTPSEEVLSPIAKRARSLRGCLKIPSFKPCDTTIDSGVTLANGAALPLP